MCPIPLDNFVKLSTLPNWTQISNAKTNTKIKHLYGSNEMTHLRDYSVHLFFGEHLVWFSGKINCLSYKRDCERKERITTVENKSRAFFNVTFTTFPPSLNLLHFLSKQNPCLANHPTIVFMHSDANLLVCDSARWPIWFFVVVVAAVCCVWHTHS